MAEKEAPGDCEQLSRGSSHSIVAYNKIMSLLLAHAHFESSRNYGITLIRMQELGLSATSSSASNTDLSNQPSHVAGAQTPRAVALSQPESILGDFRCYQAQQAALRTILLRASSRVAAGQRPQAEAPCDNPLFREMNFEKWR